MKDYEILKKEDVGNQVQTWSPSFTAAQYFMFSNSSDENPDDAQSIADSTILYAESRDFSYKRSNLESSKRIPTIESHPIFLRKDVITAMEA